MGMIVEQYWTFQYPKEEPKHWLPHTSTQDYAEDYSGLYFSYDRPGLVTRHINKALWFDTIGAAEWHYSDLGMLYLEIIQIEIRIG